MADQRIAPWAGLAVLVAALILITHTLNVMLPSTSEQAPAPMRIGTPASCTQDLAPGCRGERALMAYLTHLNDHGGIAGHTIELLSYDDTQQTEQQLSKWAEDNTVLALLSSPRPPLPRRAPRPQADTSLMFPRGGRDDRHRRPWSMSASLTPHTQGSLFAQYLLNTVLGAKVGLLYQDDAVGQGIRQGFINALGESAQDAILQEQTFDTHVASLQTQVAALRNSGANVLVNLSPALWSAESVVRVQAIGWRPLHFLADAPPQMTNTDASRGIITAQFLKHPDGGNPISRVDPSGTTWEESLSLLMNYLSGKGPAQNVFGPDSNWARDMMDAPGVQSALAAYAGLAHGFDHRG